MVLHMKSSKSQVSGSNPATLHPGVRRIIRTYHAGEVCVVFVELVEHDDHLGAERLASDTSHLHLLQLQKLERRLEKLLPMGGGGGMGVVTNRHGVRLGGTGV